MQWKSAKWKRHCAQHVAGHKKDGRKRAGWRIFCFLFVFCSKTKTSKQSSFLFLQISRGQGWRWKKLSLDTPPPPPSPFASGQQGPTGRAAFRVGSQSSTSLPHCGYVGGSPSPAGTVFGGLASAPLTISLALENHQTRLCNSVRPASSQVQGHSVYLCVEQRCSCLACKNRGPIGEGRDRACPSSWDEVWVLQPLLHRAQERRWVKTNLGPARSELGPSQAPVQDVDAEMHISMHSPLQLVRSDRPEGCILSCLDPPSTQTISSLCVRKASISVQSPPLLAVNTVSTCLYQGYGGSPRSFDGKRHSHSQLPRRLAHTGPVSSTVVRTQGNSAQSPQPVKVEDLFSWYEVGLGQPHSTSLNRTCSVDAELPGVFPGQEGGSTETVSESPGAYGICNRCHASRFASYETASVLASRPSPETGTTYSVTPSCHQTFSSWSDLAFLRAWVPLVRVSRHVVVSTDASAMGWGAMCNGHAAAGLWTGPWLQWHINCLELLAV